ncbi:MAG TPA: cellulose synthase operon protein YhjQ/BcsQ, partial [Candidatus Eisenbacteria bacterium]|nr:cellulose synthase operon protein YhjQ/BcsQ [Candidatus Eisenbacteria bacterium]
LKVEHPSMGVIVTAQDASPQVIVRCMRSGAQEFLTRPVDNRELGEAVRRLGGLARRTTGMRRRTGKTIAVFSSKGGVGVTSVATNLAVAYAKNLKKNTVLVDLNLQMGDVGLQLDLRPEYTMADAAGPTNLDESRLRGLLTRHDSGVQLLSTPEDPIEAEKVTPGALLEIFGLLRGMFDVIVVDAGHVFDSRVLEVLNLADIIVVVAVLDVPTVRNVRRCIGLFQQLGYSTDKVRIVVNRYEKRTEVKSDHLEEVVESKVFWQIPNDYKTVISAIDAGNPAVLRSPRSKMSQSIDQLARELVKGSMDLAPQPESGEDERDLPTSAAQ